MRSGAISILYSAFAVAFLSACPEDMVEPNDAGTVPINSDAGMPDVGPVPASCLCEDQEDCSGCLEHIGRCCYDDVTIEGQAENIAVTCAQNAACKACCNECKAKSCEELKANGECPNLESE